MTGRGAGALPSAAACACLAMDLADGPPIPYRLGGETPAGMDCQGLIEYVLRRLGGRLDCAGSNHMYRSACREIRPISRREGLVPGCVLFLVRADGEEPSRYRGDGLGNASHVGWYTGGRHQAVHASKSAGRVAPCGLGGWTHWGRLRGADYEKESGMTDTGGFYGRRAVRADNGSPVRLRRHPTVTSSALVNVPCGETVEVTGEEANRGGLLWTPVRYDVYSGWMMSAFLREEGEPAPGSLADLAARVAALEAWRRRAEEASA